MSKNPFLPPWGLLLKTLVEQSAEYDAEQRGERIIRDEHNMIIGSVKKYPHYPQLRRSTSSLRRTGAPSKTYQRSGSSKRRSQRHRRRRRKGFYWSYKHKRWMKSKF